MKKQSAGNKIIVLGEASDFHATHVFNQLEAKQIEADIVDTRLLAQQFNLSWSPNNAIGRLFFNTSQTTDFSSIKSVFWRSIDIPFQGELQPQLKNCGTSYRPQEEAISLLKTFFYSGEINWVNGISAYQFHRVKPRQLRAAKQIGATIPNTLVTNSKREALTFSRECGDAVIKPVQGGGFTRWASLEALQSSEPNKNLDCNPITVQQYISGTNIRTFVIGDSVYSAKIDSDHIDFREDADIKISPVNTPYEIKLLSKAICTSFGMQWTAIDWRKTDNGDYYFLEANPSPMFYFFEQQTGFPITESLIDLLVA